MPKPSVLTCDQLAVRFEGLGDNCEFGLVQSLCGAEPLGLFRFIGARLDSIIDVIKTGGVHLFTNEDINLYHSKHTDEYMLDSRHYSDFQYHTYTVTKTYDFETMMSKRTSILSYLKRRLFEEIRQSEKIFVRKGSESIVDLRRLHAELNMLGPNTLLCVAEADADHKAGTIEKIDDGLWRGYLRYFKRFAFDEPIDIVSWVEIMKRTYKAVHSNTRWQSPSRLACGRMLLPPFQVATEVTPLKDSGSVNLRILQDCEDMQTIASRKIEFSVEPKIVIVFSARIKIDEDFRGQRVDIRLDDLPLLHCQSADLARRGMWQTIFGTCKVPVGYRGGTLTIKATVSSGSSLSIDGWAIETGPIPSANDKRFSHQELKRRAVSLLHAQRSRVSLLLAKRDTGDIFQASARAMARGSFVAADDMLAIALANAPDDPALLKQYAFSANNSGRHTAAIARWQKALHAAPHDPMCHAGIACNFREFGEVNYAADLIAHALQKFPEDGNVLAEAARIATQKKRFDEAIIYLERAISIYGPLENLTIELDCARANADAARQRFGR